MHTFRNLGREVAGAGIVAVVTSAGMLGGCSGEVAGAGEGAGTGSGSSSGSSGSGSGGGNGDSCQSNGVQCAVPPASPPGGSPTSAAHNYAIQTLYLGDTDRTGIVTPMAWQAYGYNLDNLVTTKAATDVCQLAPGAAKTTQIDGQGGIDNSFGENLLPIFFSVSVTQTQTPVVLDQWIQNGGGTTLLYVSGFDDSTDSAASATGLSAVLLNGGTYPGGPPSWDLRTHWPILASSINGCGPGGCPAGTDPVAGARARFPDAYQKNGTFVSGTPATVELTFGPGKMFDLPLRSAVITFVPATPGSVTHGTIAGVMVTDDYVRAFQGVARYLSPSLCSATAMESVTQQIRQASDILVDPALGVVSNVGGQPCNGISVGLGFDAVEIAPPVAADIQAPQPAPPDPCAD